MKINGKEAELRIGWLDDTSWKHTGCIAWLKPYMKYCYECGIKLVWSKE